MTGVFVLWSDRSNSPGWIEDGTGCHIWFGSIGRHGYGSAWDGTRVGLAHRIRYEREVGPVPAGLVLDHFVCDNRRCCNPHHVRPATNGENTRRSETAIAAKHARKTHCKHGHEFTAENTYNHKGARICKTCTLARQRREYHRRVKYERMAKRRLKARAAA